MKRKSYVGERFGKLLVTDMIYGEFVNGRIRTQCKCICDCGSVIITTIDSVKKSKTSCGCDTKQKRIDHNRKDLTGKRFKRLVVEEMLWDYRPTRARCSCDCGNIVDVISTGLTSGKTGSCGCLHKDRASLSNTKNWAGVISSTGVEFLEQSHKNTYGQWLWSCRCGLCGSLFVALPAKVMNGHITSCGCRKSSSGEDRVKSILNELGIEFSEQYRFQECKDRYTLPFDFALYKEGNIISLVEYDGIQHYTPIDIFGGELEYHAQIKRDKIKTDFCKNNKINLLRLPYTLSDNQIKEKILDIIYP